jgi:ferredoxin--NADP+ reductase
VYEENPLMDVHNLDLEQRYTARVVSNQLLTPADASEEVHELVLEVGAARLEHHPGQSIAIIVPGPHELGHHEHVRLYTIAGHQHEWVDQPRLNICVRRCTYIDPYSGEAFAGVASNYLCDLPEGADVILAGPYGEPFEVPEDAESNILMIGLGTGIAPFRAFVRHLYETPGTWSGRVRLFYGARTGLELAYMNDHRNDFAQYLDEDTFEAFAAVSPRPHWEDPVALDAALEAHAEEVWALLQAPDTYVYLAGLARVEDGLDVLFRKLAGSAEKWERRKAELIAGGRWREVLY